jgi:hypothetical protein
MQMPIRAKAQVIRLGLIDTLVHSLYVARILGYVSDTRYGDTPDMPIF